MASLRSRLKPGLASLLALSHLTLDSVDFFLLNLVCQFKVVIISTGGDLHNFFCTLLWLFIWLWDLPILHHHERFDQAF